MIGQNLLRATTPRPGDPVAALRDLEFRVFSQFGEDGIIAYLAQHVSQPNACFVEIGVEDYKEANTRFLLLSRNWRGVAVDATSHHRAELERTGLMWRHHIDAIVAFVEPDNIDRLLDQANVPQEIGLFSLDIDGSDYWVIRATRRSAKIVIVEYNAGFGPEAPITVPYERRFRRSEKHFSNLYFGASLAAFDHLLRSRGYRLVGCNSAGNNAFFLHDSIDCGLPTLSPKEAYVASSVREARDQHGRLTYCSLTDPTSARLLMSLPVHDVARDVEAPLGSYLG